jgi:hypothetical protein
MANEDGSVAVGRVSASSRRRVGRNLRSILFFFFFWSIGSDLTILGQQKHSRSSAHVSGYGPDVAGEGVQEEMPLRRIITSVGLQP